MTSVTEIRPAAYYALCANAERLGIPVSLDDPDSPQTVQELVDAVVVATQRAWSPIGDGAFPLRSAILASYGLTEAL